MDELILYIQEEANIYVEDHNYAPEYMDELSMEDLGLIK